MQRFVVAIALAVLALPAQAGAKGFISLSVCGTNGCHTTHNSHELSDAEDSAPQADPGRTGAFFKLRQTIGEPGNRHFPEAHVQSYWFPALGVVRGDEGPLSGWTLPTPATQRVLKRLSRGSSRSPPRSSRARRATLRRRRSPSRSATRSPTLRRPAKGGGGGAWKLSLLAVLPAGLVFAMRRRGRWNVESRAPELRHPGRAQWEYSTTRWRSSPAPRAASAARPRSCSPQQGAQGADQRPRRRRGRADRERDRRRDRRLRRRPDQAGRGRRARQEGGRRVRQDRHHRQQRRLHARRADPQDERRAGSRRCSTSTRSSRSG